MKTLIRERISLRQRGRRPSLFSYFGRAQLFLFCSLGMSAAITLQSNPLLFQGVDSIRGGATGGEVFITQANYHKLTQTHTKTHCRRLMVRSLDWRIIVQTAILGPRGENPQGISATGIHYYITDTVKTKTLHCLILSFMFLHNKHNKHIKSFFYI